MRLVYIETPTYFTFHDRERICAMLKEYADNDEIRHIVLPPGATVIPSEYGCSVCSDDGKLVYSCVAKTKDELIEIINAINSVRGADEFATR